jgi:hypothetical protein
MTPGPNGCTCGHNGDCNCPFVASPASDAPKPKKLRNAAIDYRALARTYHDVLAKIAKAYMTPEQLRRAVERRGDQHYGLSAEEAIEMAYDNVQAEARAAIAGRRRP